MVLADSMRHGQRLAPFRAVLEADPKARFITCLADEEVSA